MTLLAGIGIGILLSYWTVRLNRYLKRWPWGPGEVL